MNSISQEMKFRYSLMKYVEKFGVAKACRKYNKCRSYIYFWKARFDGSIESLAYHSRKPHSHPNQHTEEELTLIRNMRRRNPKLGIVELWARLRERGYKRCVESLWRVLRREGLAEKEKPKKKYKPKPYEQMQHPGQRVQIDVKFVPQSCIAGQEKGTQYYQYTFIDEYSRFRYLEAFEEHNTYSSTVFLLHVMEKFPFRIECVQTDNGTEFTNRLLPRGSDRLTLFEQTLQKLGIRHKLIRPYTPRHNGKVERSHRKDNEEFYALHSFYSFDDFKKQLAVRERAYNNFPMRPLNWRSPKQVLDSFSSV